MQLCPTPAATSAVFDDPNLVSSAGLVPVVMLARSAGLQELAQTHLSVPTWLVLAVMAFNLTRAAAIITGRSLAKATMEDGSRGDFFVSAGHSDMLARSAKNSGRESQQQCDESDKHV